MKMIENNYVKAVALLIFILIAVSFTSINDAILESTGNVVESSLNEKLLLDCDFENSLICRSGEMPTKTQGITFVEGIVGKGILVDKDAFLEYMALNNFDYSKGTIEFWVKPDWDSSDEGAHRFFFTKSAGWTFYIGTGEFNYHLYFKTGYGNVKYNIHNWNIGEWHYITTTWEKLETRVYIDGVYQANGKYYSPSGPPEKIYIGSEDLQTNQASAVIDEFKIYNYVRPIKQIKEDYESYIKKELPLEPIKEKNLTMEISPVNEPAEGEPSEGKDLEYIGTGEKEPPELKKDSKLNILFIVVAFLVIIIIYLVMQLKKKK